jgi:hypothetical protein
MREAARFIEAVQYSVTEIENHAHADRGTPASLLDSCGDLVSAHGNFALIENRACVISRRRRRFLHVLIQSTKPYAWSGSSSRVCTQLPEGGRLLIATLPQKALAPRTGDLDLLLS